MEEVKIINNFIFSNLPPSIDFDEWPRRTDTISQSNTHFWQPSAGGIKQTTIFRTQVVFKNQLVGHASKV